MSADGVGSDVRSGGRGWGLTVPQLGLPLREHADLIRALPDWGYTDLWSAETSGTDAFTPLALASAWEPTLRLGTAIVPAFTRGPALIAMSAAALAAAAPGRFVLGLGASSPVIVGNWNGIEFTEPYRKTRDVLRIVRQALAGERVDGEYDTVAVKRFKLEQAPAEPPPILLAALRPQMLRLAGREADGAILNWLAAHDVAQCLTAVDNPGADVVARIFVCPSADDGYARMLGKTLISTYLTVPAYAAFHDWLGRGDALRAMHEAWAAGDRKGAAAAIPDEVVDDLVIHGAPERCREQVQAYADAGVRTPAIAMLPTPETATPQGIFDAVRRMGRA
jgi:probable F420-dependent oxidoreductase